MKQHKLCVIATVHAEKEGTESALIGFTEKDNLEICFGTSNHSRKYKNIQKNNHVSLVMGWSSELGNLQYEGIAKELSPEESAAYSELQIKKNPYSEKFVQRSDHRYFSITPTWIKFTDNSSEQPNVYEIDF